jgi:RNA polymerase sigma-70 factor (ECF subfamily)
VPGSADENDAAAYRPLLFSIAYGMTGSVGDAEDIVQDAFVGMTRARQAGTEIAEPKAYLTTAVTRLGINYLRSARVRRETYVGDWLPEPVVVPAAAPGPAEHAELADSLSMAFLVLLEALSPVERAVFMLREVFGYGYPDVARITGKTEVNCRQIFARAKQRIAAGGQAREAAPPIPARRAEGEELARRFFEATAGGDMDALLGMLAPDVVFHGDGGGKAQAIGQPMAGRERVLRLLLGLFRRGRILNISLRLAWVNGQPGAVSYDAEGRVINVFALEISDGVVQAIRSVVNPDKLGHLGPVSDVARLPEKELASVYGCSRGGQAAPRPVHGRCQRCGAAGGAVGARFPGARGFPARPERPRSRRAYQHDADPRARAGPGADARRAAQPGTAGGQAALRVRRPFRAGRRGPPPSDVGPW